VTRLLASVAVGALALGGLVAPSWAVEPVSPTTVSTVLPASPARIQGTPAEILAETPIVEPLPVGYTPGLFLSPADLKKKDSRGCTWRNRVLIALASKKPRIGAKCALSGGEWMADFGLTKVTQASQVRIGKLLPDKYVYAQGAYGWTPAQRKAYADSVLKPQKSTRGIYVGDLNSLQYQAFTIKSIKYIGLLNNLMDAGTVNQDPLERELNLLRARNPGIFDSWTVATLLNAKSWGLSLSPGTAGNFAVTISQCAASNSVRINGKTIPYMNSGKMSRPMPITILPTVNPCASTFNVPNQAEAYGIKIIPVTASSEPPTSNAVLSGYGTPIRPPVNRFLFGMHAPADWVSDVATGFNGPILTETIPNVPVGYLRLWDTQTTWRDLEPTPGNWQWRFLDKQIEMGQLLDARVMLVLGGTPAWAGNGAITAPPKVDSWRNYVKSVCAKYGASISAYEIWNEANLTTFWTGTAEQMAELTKAAFEEIRACNPNALVVAANTTSRATGSFGNFYPDYLAALGKLGWPVDAYSVHSYPTASGGADDRLKGIGQFRAMLALAGAPQSRVFDTEVNYGLAGLGETRVDITGANAMTLLSRTYIDSVRYDFDSTFWFVWTKAGDNKLGIQFTRNTPSERQAWNVTYDWLVGAQFQRCFQTMAGVTVCQFNKGANNFSIVWAGDVGAAPLSTTPGYFTGLGSRTCDLFQACTAITASTPVSVGPMPMRIDGPPLTAGPTSTVPSDPAGPSISPVAPVIVDIDLSYGVSNKADATATWAAPFNAKQAGVDGYSYSWSFCKGARCSVMANGTSDGGTFTASMVLGEGPGTYEFQVAARRGATTGPSAQQRVTLLRSDAAPPSDVIVGVRGSRGEVVWSAPNMRSQLIDGYEVQVQNTASGTWVTVAERATALKVAFDSSKDLNLSAGETITARVRTVLKSQAKSIFAASSPLLIQGQLGAPRVTPAFGLFRTGELYTNVSPPTNSRSTRFPGSAYQIRYSTDGVTWEFARFLFDLSSTTTPAANATLFPYDTPMSVSAASQQGPFPGGARFQVRAIDDSGLPPSEWIDMSVIRAD
jgi:hypothetical protein